MDLNVVQKIWARLDRWSAAVPNFQTHLKTLKRLAFLFYGFIRLIYLLQPTSTLFYHLLALAAPHKDIWMIFFYEFAVALFYLVKGRVLF